LGHSSHTYSHCSKPRHIFLSLQHLLINWIASWGLREFFCSVKSFISPIPFAVFWQTISLYRVNLSWLNFESQNAKSCRPNDCTMNEKRMNMMNLRPANLILISLLDTFSWNRQHESLIIFNSFHNLRIMKKIFNDNKFDSLRW